jgi:serine/threonine protein kinase
MQAAMRYSERVGTLVGDLGAGTVLGRYELLAPVAKGGMAMVWAARLQGSRGFQKIVAVKTMLPSLGEDPLFEQMFLDEASLASQVRHPNVVEILDLGEQDGVLYLVMEWVEGDPLSMLMKHAATEPMPLPVAARIALQACQGLHAAHELRGETGELVSLVHRDVSPQNILVTYGGVVKVVDFGVAKAAGRIAAETSGGQVKGKIPYMSPEQATGGEVDRRTDVFAMGILLYMMTTGRHPFRRENDAQTLMNITSTKPVVPPRGIVADYPPELSEIVVRALAKDPSKRFASAADMAAALDALPKGLRAGSDAIVTDYVKSLLGERVQKRKALLREALRAADERALGRASQAMFNPESTISSQTGLSAYGPVSTQLRTSLPPGADSERSSVAALSMPEAQRLSRSGVHTRRGPRIALWAIGVALLLGGLIAVVQLRSSEPAGARVTEPPAARRGAAGNERAASTVASPAIAPSLEASSTPPDDSAPVAASALPMDQARAPTRSETPAPRPAARSPKSDGAATDHAASATPPAAKPPSERPFMSPIRDPGF